MLGLVHSATCIRAENFGIPFDHLTPEMTHLECGKIIPAVSTTTGIITGLLLNEMVKMKMGVTELSDLHEYQLNLSVPSIYRNYLMNPSSRQENGSLVFDFDFLISQNPQIDANKCMDERGFWNAWCKHDLPGDITFEQLEKFVEENYNASPTLFQVYPNFRLLDDVRGSEIYNTPVVEAFPTIIDTKNDKYAIVHVAFQFEGNPLC